MSNLPNYDIDKLARILNVPKHELEPLINTVEDRQFARAITDMFPETGPETVFTDTIWRKGVFWIRQIYDAAYIKGLEAGRKQVRDSVLYKLGLKD